MVKGLLKIKPVYVAILTDEKKYSPGASCKNFIPCAGCCNMKDIFLLYSRQIIVITRKNIRALKIFSLNSSKCSKMDIVVWSFKFLVIVVSKKYIIWMNGNIISITKFIFMQASFIFTYIIGISIWKIQKKSQNAIFFHCFISL